MSGAYEFAVIYPWGHDGPKTVKSAVDILEGSTVSGDKWDYIVRARVEHHFIHWSGEVKTRVTLLLREDFYHGESMDP